MNTESQARSLTHVRNALYAQPWAIMPEWLDTLCGIVAAHEEGKQTDWLAAQKMPMEKKKSKMQMMGKTAVVPIVGPIFPKSNLFTEISGATSCQEITDMIQEAIDAQPDAILLQVDSPGGAVSGITETADAIFQARETSVPVLSAIEGVGASAAYWLASQADEVIVSRGSVVGSISIISRMATDERMMRNAGVDSLTLSSGAMKNAEMAFVARGGGSVTDMQNMVDRMKEYHAMFVEAISRGRPSLNTSTVDSGATWIGQRAVTVGLADRVGTLQSVLRELS